MVKEILLANGKGVAIVDAADFEEVNRYNWHLRELNTHCYAQAPIKSEKTKSGQTQLSMHRLILKASKKEQVDHINNNGLDNRKINLRMCNPSQNHGNQRKYKKDTSSQYKGVYWHTRGKKWAAFIRYNSIRIHLGLFDIEDYAALAYNTKAVELFGEFSYLNKVVG